MTKRRDVIRRIARAAKAGGHTWGLARQGANHEVYSLDGQMIPVPRHNEIGERMAQAIYCECESVFGKGWWR